MSGSEKSYAAAREVTRYHARSFYFASHFLPSGKRRHAYAVYACCRYIDDQIDDLNDPAAVPETVARLREWLGQVYASGGRGGEDVGAWVPAFCQTARACEVEKRFFDDLLDGVEMDQGKVRVRDWPELEKYCYHVAGVVGLMMTRVFGLEDRSHEKEAIELGNAMQLTNILRDVAEDWKRDRIYLPADEMERFGLTEEVIARGENSKEWKEMMKFQIERARDGYIRSERGIGALPADGSQATVWAMRDVYAGILTAIEVSDYDVFRQRCHVTLAGKIRLVLAGWLGRRGNAGGNGT